MKFNTKISNMLKSELSGTKIAKRLLATCAATLAMALVFFAISYLKTTEPTLEVGSTDDVTAIQAEDGSIVGLSRQRKDFDKAIDLLAQGASANPDLADYLDRVQLRVKGEKARPELGSGVRVVRKSASKTAGAKQNGAATVAQAEQKPRKLMDKIKGFIGGAMVSAPESAKAGTAAKTASHATQAGAPRLTTGDMAFETNPAIEKWVRYYTTSQVGRRTMDIGIKRSDKYLDMARAEFRKAGVPEDLVWLAFVESVWHPEAVSPAAAGGLWQFIPKTATEYGLSVSTENDERRDPMKQTRVAAAYLSDLHTIFGDWTLAMAAYNCGEPRVMDALIKNGRVNFWDLYERELLPKETREYVPKILAAIQVASRADNYGFLSDQASGADVAGR